MGRGVFRVVVTAMFGKSTVLSSTRVIRSPQTTLLGPDGGLGMCPASAERVSELLLNWGHGDKSAREELIPLVYVELRRIHDEPPQWQNRAHFFGVAAQLMRHILVDHARSRLAVKRGAGAPRLALDSQIGLPQKREVN